MPGWLLTLLVMLQAWVMVWLILALAWVAIVVWRQASALDNLDDRTNDLTTIIYSWIEDESTEDDPELH